MIFFKQSFPKMEPKRENSMNMAEILNQYQMEASRTLNLDTDRPIDNYLLGLMGESGEVIDVIKKRLYHGHDLGGLAGEIGDICWYLAAICSSVGNGNLYDCWRLSSNTWSADVPLQKFAFDIFNGVNNVRLCLHCILPGSQSWDVSLYGAVGYILRVCSGLCQSVSLNFLSVLDANIAKLRKRYPEKFSSEASRARIE